MTYPEYRPRSPEILAVLQARRYNAAKPTRWFSKLVGWFRGSKR